MRYNKYMNNTTLTAALLIDLLSNVPGDAVVGLMDEGTSIAISGIRFTTEDGQDEFVFVGNTDDPTFVFEL